MVTVEGIKCGTFVRTIYEVFGYDRGQWIKIVEHERICDAQESMRAHKSQGLYEGVAYTERTVKEVRNMIDSSVPRYQLVMELFPDFGDEPELVKEMQPDLATAMKARKDAMTDPVIRSARVVDLTTMRSVAKEAKE